MSDVKLAEAAVVAAAPPKPAEPQPTGPLSSDERYRLDQLRNSSHLKPEEEAERDQLQKRETANQAGGASGSGSQGSRDADRGRNKNQ